MDDSPYAQLIQHAKAASDARSEVTKAAHQLAADAEADRPGKRTQSGHQAAAGQS